MTKTDDHVGHPEDEIMAAPPAAAPRRLPPADLGTRTALAQIVADRVGIGYTSAMEAPDSPARSRLLYELGCAFAGQLDLNELLPLIMRKCCDALLAEGAAVLLLDNPRGEFFFRFVADDDHAVADRLIRLRFPADRGIAGAALRAGSGIRVDDVATDARFYPDIDSHTGLRTRAILAVPLMTARGALGVVEVVNRRDGTPFSDDDLQFLDALAGSITLAIDNARLYRDVKTSEERLRAENAFLRAVDTPHALIGNSPPMRRLLDEIRRVAPKDVPVLIQGETGTGKELVARSIHGSSGRRNKLFVPVNCAELSQDAAESRLFGHRKGSFTGAIDDHKGFFEVADGGTLFLDEIGELPLTLQAKLLRALQEGEITRFGDNRPRHVNVRVIAATNRNLDAEVKAVRFRPDLLYRLNVFPITVPPLRSRREDIALLAEHFLALHACKMDMPVPALTPAAREALAGLHYAGNVRDLENMMVRALVMAEHGEPITPDDLAGPETVPFEGEARGPSIEVRESEGLLARVARFEREQIMQAIESAGGNRAEAARALKISYRWLLKKLERYGTESGGDGK